MDKIKCSIITNQVRQLAAELGVSDTYANNLINTWRTLYNKNITEFPSKSDILDLHLKDRENIYLAVPKYEKLPFEENSSLAFTRDGTIYLRRIFDEKTLEYFFDYITGKVDSSTSKQKQEVFKRLANNGYSIDKIRELISSTTEAYRFLLWHEMSHIEFNDGANYYKVEREKHGDWDNLPADLQKELIDYLTEDKIEIEYRATLEAIKKAEAWRKSHPIQYASEELKNKIIEYSGYFEGGGIYITDDYPEMPKELASKIESFILGDFPLTQKDALDFINIVNINSFNKENNNLNYYEFYSGAAKGADTVWKEEAGSLGIKTIDYTEESWDNLSKEWQDKLSKEYEEVARYLARPIKASGAKGGKLVRRNMMQADKADAIFAIGTIIKPGEKDKKGYINRSNHEVVEGGTAYAATRGILRGIPVYVFDQSDNQWKVWSVDANSFITISEPTLTPHAATIGTREINDSGRQAIKNILNNTFNTDYSNNIVVKSSYSEHRENLELIRSQEPQIDSENDVDGTPLVGINHINVKLDSPRDKANRAFNVTTRQDRVNLISRQFSDIIDVLQEEFIEDINDKLVSAKTDNNIEAVRLLEEELALLTDKENGRKAIVEKATVSEIISRLKEQWKYYSEQSIEELDKNFEGRGEYVSSEYNKVLEHFDILLEDAALDIESREGIRIVFEKIKYYNGSETKESLGGIVQKDNTQEENDSNENNENDGERVNNSDGFGYKARFIDPHSTLSKEVKRVLGNLVKENEYSGEPEVDDLGNFRYIDSAHAHAILLSALYDMVDADDFSIVDEKKEIISLPALEKAAEKYPWINQVIEAIELDNNLASKFYTDLRKEFIVYWGHREGKTIEYNGTTVVDDTIQNVTYDYEKGIKHSKNSLYNEDKSINIDNASLGITKSDDIISDLKDGDIELLESKIDDIIEVFRMLGFNPTAFTIQSLLQSEDGIVELMNSLQIAKEIFDGSKELSPNTHLINEYQNFYEVIANSVGHLSETGGIASFKVGDKTLYSYSAPNYIDGMIKKFKNDSKRGQYLQSEFKYDKWFYEDGKWKNKWLEQIENDEEVIANLRTIDLYNLEGDYYTEWDGNRIYHGFIKQYFAAGYNPNSSTQFAWYNFPIFSDSPVVKFIKFVRYTENVKETIIPLLANVVEQELGRIRNVQERRAKGVPQISNYDKTGDKFHFFPQLNNYIRISDGRNFMQTLLEMVESKNLSEKREFIETTLQEILATEFSNFYTKIPSSIKNELISEGYASEETVQEKIEEYFYNHYFATSQIIQLTTTDLAFYKDSVDFQKRFKEVYASGNRLNTNSKYGKKVERTIYIKDEVIQSLGFDNIKSILDQAVKDKKLSSLDRDFLLTQYKNVNVTDAQAFRSLDSYRSILDMMGKWTEDMEKTFERIQKGEWDMADFTIVWQTIKPFVFTNMRKPDGLGGFIRVPHQHKNSEFLLTAMYHMFSKRLSESPKLRAINQFMHDNNIDVVQFDSAVKVGGQGVIDLRNIDSYEDVIKELNKCCFEGSDINPVVVHEVSYDDYMVQQPTPEHLMDTVAIYGSQFRNLIISDMSDDPNFRVTVNGKEYTKQELLSLYQGLIVENLLDSYESLKEEIGYNDIDKLQKLLLKQVKGNPKYGRDIIDALQIVEVINPVTGLSQRVFNIPLSNPTTTTQIQELINSLFKNRITKQEIKGGNCILVSSVGLTKELQILYNEDGSVKGVECYMPAYSKQFYETLLDEKTGELKYDRLPEELKKLIGYRIPTEGKYSMLPLYIKGFLPQQNGSAIMLPADITTISGADFDVDKLFLMIPEFKVQRYNMKKARADYARQNSMFEALLKPYSNSQLVADILSSEPEDFKEWFGKNKANYLLDKPRIYKIKYDTSKNPEEQSLEARNNMLIDISYSILTHPETAYKFLSAGNFNKVKKAAKIKTILNDSSLLETYMLENNLTLENAGEHLLNNDEKVLGDFVKKYIKLPSPLSLESFVYFHKQNTTGGKLIGMYANNTSLQAKFQESDLSVFSDYIFNMNGRPLNSLHDIVSGLGELISKNCAEFSAASVDDVKDPNLAQLDQRPDTANITATMLRLGMSIEEIGLMFSHPYIRTYLNRPSYERSLEAPEFRMLAGNKIDLSKLNITSKDMINAILEVNTSENPYEVLENGKYTHISSAMLQIIDAINIISEALNTINKSNRVDSTNNAIDINFAGAVVQRFNVDDIHLASRKYKYPITGVSSTISNRYVSPSMSKEELRKKFNSHKFPMLQAFYSLGIEFADELVSNYFIQTTPYVRNFLTKLRIDTEPLSSKTINSLYKDIIYFGLTNTELFGDSPEMSMKDKENYYLNKFPNKFKQVIRNNPDIASLGVIKKMTVENGVIKFNKSARMTKMKREFFSRDFDSLLYSDNPEAIQLAYDLFMYSFYKEHLDFGPNNYGYFFSSWFLSSFPEYIDAMRTMQFEMQEGSYFDRFKLQYYYQNPWLFKDAPKGEFSGDDYIIEAKKARNPKVSGVGYYEYLNYSNPFGPSYLLVLDRARSNNEVAIYTIQDTLKRGVFNAKSDVVTLIEENSSLDNQVTAPPINTTPQTVDVENIPLEDFDLLDGDVEIPDIDMNDAPDNLYDALSYFENLDLYNEADGEALLDNPLCDYL